MFFVFFSGIVGFLVFDAYRFRRMLDATGQKVLTFGSALGVLVHLGVYFAAGVFAVFVSLDVVIDWGFFSAPNDEMVGPLMRGFALGVAGPAGLSRTPSIKRGKVNFQRKDLGTLEGRVSVGRRVKSYLDILLLRGGF